MTDSSDQKPPAPAGPGGAGDVMAPPPEEDALFRLQMAVSDAILGYWKYAVGALGVVLLGAAVYGGVTSYQTSRTRDDYEAVARVDYRMPKIEDAARYGLAPMDDPADTQRMADLTEGGRRFLAAGDDASGTAAVYAYMKAADAFRRARQPDQQLQALQKAWGVGAEGLPAFSAGSALATAQLDAGKPDDALATLRAMVGSTDGLYAEEALVSLAGLQADLGRSDDAKATIQEFRTRFPESPRAANIAAVESRLGSGG